VLTSAPALAGKNIIVNGDAETGASASNTTALGPPSGWERTGEFNQVQYGADAFAKTADLNIDKKGPSSETPGKAYFAGGNTATSTGTQVIDVSGAGGWIDGGSRTYQLQGFLGGFESQADFAVVNVTFQDANGRALGTAQIGPVSPLTRNSRTALIFSQTHGTVPKGTRKVQVKVTLTRIEGNYNDGYADDLSLVLS
jgi:hypothetical protein